MRHYKLSGIRVAGYVFELPETWEFVTSALFHTNCIMLLLLFSFNKPGIYIQVTDKLKKFSLTKLGKPTPDGNMKASAIFFFKLICPFTYK